MLENLNKIIHKCKGKKIIVWGDYILDEYIYTTTKRVSREAPVVVTEFDSNEYYLGGAGNVIMNLHALGANPVPVGFLGANTDSIIMRELLENKSISTEYLIPIDNYLTPKKSRILSGGENTKKQQVLRIDTLNRVEINREAYKKVELALLDLLSTIDFVIISDYIHESVNSEVYKTVRAKYSNKKIFIDSRNHLLEFENLTIATPNEPELKKLFPEKKFHNEQDFYDAGDELLKRLKAEGIIIKRGNKGMIIFPKEGTPNEIKIHGSSEIVDGTGAGDTVISVLSLALISGADFQSSSYLANIAAGKVVMKEGTHPISLNELKNELK
jgi:rfaE bifunctional protein kinase chain/domain